MHCLENVCSLWYNKFAENVRYCRTAPNCGKGGNARYVYTYPTCIMDKYYGTPVSGGTAYGRLYVLKHDECPVRRYHIDSSAKEIERLNKARAEAIAELDRLYKKTAAEISEEDACIFATQILMIEDEGFTNEVYDLISDELINAETAVALTNEKYCQLLDGLENEYVRAKQFDVRDASERVIRILLGIQVSELLTTEPVIIAARDLPPSDIVRFDKDKILGFMIEKGDEKSHAAVLARSKGVPAVIRSGSFTEGLKTGEKAIIDGNDGVLYVEPDEETLKKYSFDRDIYRIPAEKA